MVIIIFIIIQLKLQIIMSIVLSFVYQNIVLGEIVSTYMVRTQI